MMSFQGEFFDGRSTRPQVVTITLSNDALVLSGGDSGLLVTWPYETLDSVERLRSGQPVQLSPAQDHDARLRVADTEFAAALLSEAPHLGRRFGRRKLKRSEKWFIGLAAFTAILLFAAFLPATNKYLVRFFPETLERRLGAQTRAVLFRGAKICENPAAQKIIDDLTRRLTKDRPMKNLRVHVVDSDFVNAFALAGGDILFSRGIMAKFTNAEQFAGVLAHEIAHEREKHPVQSFIRIYGMDFLAQMMLGDDTFIANIGGTAVLMAFSRDMEAEADAIAVKLLRNAGITTRGLAEFFEIIAVLQSGGGKKNKKAGGAGSNAPERKSNPQQQGTPKDAKDPADKGDTGISLGAYFSTHPGTRQRIAMLRRMAAQGGPAMSAADWRIVKNICGPKKK